jgi:hypothetical protein
MTHTKRRTVKTPPKANAPVRQHGSPIAQMAKPIKQVPVAMSVPFKLQ